MVEAKLLDAPEFRDFNLVTFPPHLTDFDTTSLYCQLAFRDPVSGHPQRLVVPAELSVDVTLHGGAAVEAYEEDEEDEEEEVEEETKEEVAYGKRGAVSLRGDPILGRANPPPPPDPYLSPGRPELMKYHVTARDKSTVSSFLKACGRDKYTSSRMSEIDKMIASVIRSPAAQDSASPRRSASSKSGSSRSARGGGKRPGPHPGDWVEPTRRYTVNPDTLFHQLPREVPVYDTPWRRAPKQDPSSKDGEEAAGKEAGDKPPRSPRGRGKPSPRRRHIPTPMLDPHLLGLEYMPSQRLHKNWPVDLQRKLAVSFYGRTAEQLKADEEGERQQEREAARLAKAREKGEEVDEDEEAQAVPKAAPRRDPVPSLQTGPQRKPEPHELCSHRLEIRVSQRPGGARAVVQQSL